ncbi:MAG: bifunctional (p)ppGpp synthetase/guanosine-3',5'-bis(diphosphate) 3'-pyrophosphohydrolase [Magnetococcales bacterium]|nr:bifunctional (p)ppGpp synthetase/guanosine-3',5'-bis(diphosphate) 3'-pyrophosphohydrolase [Magnetococcales bacterium]
MELMLRALQFAADKHRQQKRKDGITPYINHPIAVTETLARVGKITDMTVLLGGILHDTLEDTATTAEELTHHFGPTVAQLVQEVSDDKTLPKATRKQLQVEKAGSKSQPAKMLKLADLCCNITDLLTNPPPDWPLERRQEYLTWARRVAAGLRGSNPPLEKYLDDLIDRGVLYL